MAKRKEKEVNAAAIRSTVGYHENGQFQPASNSNSSSSRMDPLSRRLASARAAGPAAQTVDDIRSKYGLPSRNTQSPLGGNTQGPSGGNSAEEIRAKYGLGPSQPGTQQFITEHYQQQDNPTYGPQQVTQADLLRTVAQNNMVNNTLNLPFQQKFGQFMGSVLNGFAQNYQDTHNQVVDYNMQYKDWSEEELQAELERLQQVRSGSERRGGNQDSSIADKIAYLNARLMLEPGYGVTTDLYNAQRNLERNSDADPEKIAELTQARNYFAYQQSPEHRAGWLEEGAGIGMDSVARRQAIYDQNAARMEELQQQMQEMESHGVIWGEDAGPVEVYNDPEYIKLNEEYQKLKAENQKYEDTQMAIDKYAGTDLSAYDYSYTNDPKQFDIKGGNNQNQQTLAEDGQNPAGTESSGGLNASHRSGHFGTFQYSQNNLSYDDVLQKYHSNYFGPNDKNDESKEYVEDRLGFWLNLSDEAKEKLGEFAYDRTSDTPGLADYDPLMSSVYHGVHDDWDYLTEREIAIYYALYENEGKEAADQFLDEMARALNKRRSDEEEKEWIDRTNRYGGWSEAAASIYAIATGPLGGASAAFDKAASFLKGERPNPYNPYWSMLNAADTIQETVASNIDERTINKEIFGISVEDIYKKTGYTLGDLYQSGMSLGEQAYALLLGPAGYGALMGMTAFAQKGKELYDKGASDEQILAGALFAGTAEMLFETLSIEKLKIMATTAGPGFKNFLKNFMKQFATEGSEEVLTEIANTIADQLVMGTRSDMYKDYLAYKDSGYSEKDAWSMAFGNVGLNVWKAAISGGIAGGIGGATVTVANNSINRIRNAQQNRVTMHEAASAIAEDLHALETSPEAQGLAKAALGQSISTKEAQAILNNPNAVQYAAQVLNIGTEYLADAQAAKSALNSYAQATAASSSVVQSVLKGQAVTDEQVLALLKNGAATQFIADAFWLSPEQLADVKTAVQALNDVAKDSNAISQAQERISNGTVTLQPTMPATVVSQNEQQAPAQETVQAPVQEAPRLAEEHVALHPAQAQIDMGEAGVQDVVVHDIADAKAGTVYLEDGSTAKRENVAFRDSDTAAAYGSAMKYGTELGNIYMNGFNGNENYDRSFDHFYQSGLAGNSFDYTASSIWAQYIDRRTATEAFAHGRGAMRAQQARDVQKAKGKTVTEAEGGVYYSADFSEENVHLNKFQKANLQVLKEVANEKKSRVSVQRTIDGGQTNSYYDPKTDTVVIALDALEGAYVFWADHEVLHRLKEQNPEAYAKVCGFVLDVMEKQKGFNLDTRIRQIQDSYQRQKGQTLSRAAAIEEIVANCVPTAMMQENAVREFAQKNKGIIETLREWLEDFINTLKSVIQRIGNRLPEVRAIQNDVEALTKIRDAMNAGLAEIGGIRTGTESDANIVKFSFMNDESLSSNVASVLKMSDEEAIQNEREANYIRIMNNTPDVVLNHVKDAENLEIITRFDALYLAARSDGVIKGHYHNLGTRLNDLPRFISDPEAIIRLKNGRLNLFTTVDLGNRRNVILSIELNTIKDINNKYTKYNLVVTVFPAFDNYAGNIIRKEGVNVEYKKEDLQQVNPQLYKWLAIINSKSSNNEIISQGDEKSNPKFSINALDSAYMSAVEAGNEDMQERFVKEAAKLAGYTVEGYHGTTQFGFTKIDTNFSDDRMSFFVTTDLNTARTYSTTDRVTRISDQRSENYYDYSRIDMMDETLDEAENAAIEFATIVSSYAGVQGWQDVDSLENEIKEIVESNIGGDIDSFKEEFWTYCDDIMWALFDVVRNDPDAALDEYEEWIDSTELEPIRKALDNLASAYTTYAKVVLGEISEDGAGNYHVFINPTGLLTVDGNGRMWNQINGTGDLPETNGGRYWTTRTIADWAKKNGYTGVLFRNIIDDGGNGGKRSGVADVYALFNPQSQVKSADPITYDDDGNVIPLSERFNPENQDIRYSINELAPSEQMAEEANVKYSLVEDESLLRELEDQDHLTVYRAMQEIDGKLYPPMAAKVMSENGKTQLVQPTEIGRWYQSDERPDLIKNGKFTLNKGNGSSIAAAYNPYFHTSASPLNDQFSSAYKRPNLVVVQGVIPSSELTSGYKAEGAKDAVGETKWHAGPVASQLKGEKARRVYLSRYFKAERIVSDAEVARTVAGILEGENISVPRNVVTPSLLEELRKQGVQIEGEQGGQRFSINEQDLENTGVQFDMETESAAPVKYSLNTWTESEYAKNREKAARILADNLDVSYEQAEKYIDDINSVAYLIAADRIRLDYEANDTFTVIKPDSEYKFTVDASTLCAKRRTFTGTMDAIQRALPNAILTAEDRVKIRDMMMKKGYEVACGICYVESSRKDAGPKTQRFIDAYMESQRTGESIKYESTSGKTHEVRVDNAPAYASEYVPTQYDLNSSEGIDALQKSHPEVYKAYVAYMNRMGQSKPKLLETRTEYRGEIMKFRQSLIDYLNDHGGLRLQSYSDFETPHLIDMMQVVLDMSRKGLKSQAYTKIPNFARVFGSTGVKINLSLIAKGTGLDENGNLVFDDVEGMPHEEAFAIRDRYSRDVGTILVGKNDAHIIAAMADPRIDFIIPFHKSQWNQSLYEALGLTGYSDYTDFQNEKAIDGSKIKNYDPLEYWDFSKTGDENAQIYLEKCRQEGRIPKFPQFSHYPGYWKLLIDFKMYDNSGVEAPQQVVRPEFQMDEANRVLQEYEGGANAFPVAQDVVDQFLKEYNPNSVRRFAEATRNLKFSINEIDQLREDLRASQLREDNLSTTVRTQENIIEGLKEEFQLTKGHKLNRQTISRLAQRLVKQYNSTYNVQELSENLGKLFDYIANGENLDWDSVMEVSSTISKRILEESSTLNRDLYDQYKGMRDYFRTQKINIPQDMRAEVGEYFGGWNNLRKELFGRVNLTNNGASLDAHWNEICDAWPEFFDREATPQDQVMQVVNALDAIKPYYENTFGMNMDEAAYDLAQEIYEDYFSVPEVKTFADKQQQKLERTIAHMSEMRSREKQRIKDRYEQKLSALRQQKGEQMAALREQFERARGQDREMFRQRLERLRAQKNEQLMRQQAKLRTEKMEAVQRQRDLRQAAYYKQRINRILREFNQRLLSPTKEKHIPSSLISSMVEVCETMNGAYDNAKARNALMNLQDAYAEMRAHEGTEENPFFDPVIADIAHLRETLAGRQIKELSVSELKEVYDVLREVRHVVNTYNKAFVQGRRATISGYATDVIGEMNSVRSQKPALNYKILDTLKSFGWSNLKPIYAMRMIGSDTFIDLYHNLRAGEDKWAVNVGKVRDTLTQAQRKYGYNSWNMDLQRVFTLQNGQRITLDLGHMMSMYALYKRQQAVAHMEQGGVVLDAESSVKDKGVKRKTTSNPVQITFGDMQMIVDAMTDNQRAFVDELQRYLSVDMAALGNEVSMALYDMEKFTDPNYFPIQSSSDFIYNAMEKKNAAPKLINSSFTKDVVKFANNPVIISDFTETWADHCNKMCMYNAFTLPLEDFTRVFNYKSSIEEGSAPYSVKTTLTNEFGGSKDAINYIENLIRDVNGGVMNQTGTNALNKMIALFKKGAVFASASVVLQQPSAVARALAIIDTKYFLKTSFSWGLYNECMKWAPIARIKDMGYFDTGISRGAVEWITKAQPKGLRERIKAFVTDGSYRDDVLSLAPQKADAITWSHIWAACKAEQLDKGHYVRNSDEHMKAAAARFTEVIERTQVYDSVFSRSEMMRSKDLGARMVTAFMAEPTTSANMLLDGFVQGKRKGGKAGVKFAARTVAAFVGAAVLNSILKSFVTAARDDDDDKSYWEKYLGKVVGNAVDEVNPMGLIPIARDILSILQGYSVDRADMSLFEDLAKNFKNFQKARENGMTADTVISLIGSVAAFAGIPVKNIWRDIKSALNVGQDFFVNQNETDWDGIVYSIAQELGYDVSMKALAQQMLSGSGNAEMTRRMLEQKGKSQEDIDTGVRQYLKTDKTFRDYAEQYAGGDISALEEAIAHFSALGFNGDDVAAALRTYVDKEINGLESSYTGTAAGTIYQYDDLYTAMTSGNSADVTKIVNAIAEGYQADGKTLKEAKSTIRSQLTKNFKEQYIEAGEQERLEIRRMLYGTAVYDSMEALDKILDGWLKG